MVSVEGETKKALYTLIEFYLSLVAYFILHMIFVIASDFVEAFNIPPLNIGIYVDKLAAIRALLMVLSDFVEWGITQKGCNDGGNANQSLFKQASDDKDEWFGTEWNQREKWNNSGSNGPGARRWASIVSFLGMLVCRCVYLYLVYKSDNKSLTVFITLCLEGFWFGLFQMGFFAIGPEFNAYTSFGIHTMGNIIFFLQVILNYYSKSKPKINCLYRVRVHAWIVVITSIIGLLLWVCFCFWANAGTGEAPSQWPEKEDVWSPFLLFIIGAFAEDFAVPGVLPFAFLDPEKANLVNYLTPSFFMTGAMVTVIFNDWWPSINYKAWSASKGAKKDNVENGMYWHSLWLLNIPKYIAFFIAMFSIHGTYDDLRCIIQSRWRVMLLTLTVVVPRAVLETSGYVGVANWSIGRADFGLVEAELIRTIANGLKDGGVDNFPVTNATTLKNAIGDGNKDDNKVKQALAGWINKQYFSSIEAENIQANEDPGGQKKIKVEINGGSAQESTADVVKTSGVKVTITGSIGKEEEKSKNAGDIANKIASFVAVAALVKQLKDKNINSPVSLTTNGLKTAIGTSSSTNQVHTVIAAYISARYGGAAVKEDSSGNKEITANNGTESNTLKVELRDGGSSVISNGDGQVPLTFSDHNNTGVKVTINISSKGRLNDNTGGKKNDEEAKHIAQIIADSAMASSKGKGRAYAFTDFPAFDWIAWHDVTAMFCRFVYGKFAVGYNSFLGYKCT